MKKLFTKLAGAAMVLGGLAITYPSDAARVYFDARDNYTGNVYVYVVGGSDASTGSWGSNNCKPCTKINDRFWSYQTTDDTEKLIFMSDICSDDNNKLTHDCSALADGQIYTKSKTDQTGSKFMCFVGYSIEGIDGNWETSNYPMQITTDAHKLTYDFKVTKDKGYFKFYNASDSKIWGANQNTYVSLGNLYSVTEGQGSQFEIGKGDYTVTLDLSTYKITVTQTGEETEQPTQPEQDMYLVGDNINGFEGMTPSWDLKESNLVKAGQVIKIESSESVRNFAFKAKNNNQTDQFGPSNQGQAIADGEFEAAKNNNTFSVPAYTAYDLTIESCTNEKVTFSVKITEKLPEPIKDYYFVGDLNDWFSSEFSETKYVVDNTNGNYVQLPYKNEETGVEGIKYEICQKDKAPAEWDGKYYKIENQGDFKLFEDNKENWKFEFVGEIPGYDGDNWYMFDKFPYGALTGQFQISDGNKWDGDVYCHAQNIVQDKDNIYPNPDHEQYKKYCSTSITHDQIRFGEVLVKGEYDERGLLSNQNGMIRLRPNKTTGQNFHMECNAVNNAVIYFQPGDDPKMIIQGDPVDFYIFYGMKEDENTSNNNVRAQINQGKPNTNNYFLPGVWYGQYNNNNVKDGKLVLPNVPENQEHMNIEGQDLVKINLEDATVDNLKNVTDKYGNNLFYDCKTTDELLTAIVKNKVLPNNMSLEGYSEIWVQKIPNGFCNPAGRKFTLSFQESLNEADRKPVYTVTSNHMYFFSMENAHVHVDAKSIEEVANVKVSYRIYGQDAYWNTVVLTPGHLSTDVIRIYNRRETPKATASEPDGDPKKDAGWIDINSDYSVCDAWNCTHLYHGTQSNEWKYSDRTFGQEDAVNALADEAENSDPRLGVASRYSHKYVQFKLEYSPKPESGVQFKPYTVYVPSAPRAIAENQKYNLNGHDYYMNLNIDDPIVTGIEGVFDDMTVGSNQEVDATPVYYNLQGVRVENPTKGIFIKVTGSKSEKVLF